MTFDLVGVSSGQSCQESVDAGLDRMRPRIPKAQLLDHCVMLNSGRHFSLPVDKRLGVEFQLSSQVP